MADTTWTYSAVLMAPSAEAAGADAVQRMIGALIAQDIAPARVVVAGGETAGERTVDGIPVVTVGDPDVTRAALLNKAWVATEGDAVLLLASHDGAVVPVASASRCLWMATQRNPHWGLIYSDYARAGAEEQEVHLLDHHPGRVRDNQDFGRAWLVRRAAAVTDGGDPFDDGLRFHELYDLRLRVSRTHKLVHISNRYAGFLYTVEATGTGHNVFDYLLASKESQQEAEQVVTRHLRAIGAYLAPGEGYRERPAASTAATKKASVVIPVNNRPAFIGMAIESVLAQTVQQIEVIVVVNGGLDDPTIPAVNRYREGGDRYRADAPEVRLIVLDINNIGLCLNAGIDAAAGEVYVQLDSDDRLKPDAVEKVLAILADDPYAGIVIGSYEVWQQEPDGSRFRREEIPVVTHDEWTEENGRNNLLRINGAGAPRCIPTAVVRELGWFAINDEPFARNYGEDYDLVMRIGERHRVARIWDPIYEVVRHSGGTDHSIDQVTIDRNDDAKDWMRLQAIRRRRAAHGIEGRLPGEDR